MKNKFLAYALLPLAFSPVFAVEDSSTSGMQSPTTQPSMQQGQDPSQSNTSQANTSQKDGEMIALLMVLDKNEIAAAREAKSKATNPKVKAYARLMLQD